MRFSLFLFQLLAIVFSLASRAEDQIVVQLKWKHQFQFAGYYAAIEKGYYAQKGLRVVLKEADHSIDPVHEVIEGRAQYGVGSSDLLLAQTNGHPIVILATIFQHSPLALMVRSDSGITTPQELAGKKIMLEPQSAEIVSYLKNEGVSLDKVKLIPHTFNPQALINKEVDAISVYTSDEPFFLKEQKIPVTFFYPRSGGVDFLGESLFTSEDVLQRSPERTKAFVEATLKGWTYALNNPEEVTDMILEKYSKRHSREHLLFEAQNLIKLAHLELLEVGYINKERWKHIAAVYTSLGLIKNPDIDWDHFLYGTHSKPETQVLKIIGVALTLSLALFFFIVAPFYYLYWKLKKETKENEIIRKRLEESETKFRFMVMNSQDAIAILDANGGIQYISESIRKIAGFSPEEIIGKSCFHFVHTDDLPKLRESILNVLNHPSQTVSIEFRHKDKSGKWIYVEAVGANQIHNITIQGIVLNIRNINDRKQIEQENNKIQLQLIHSEKLASIGTLAAGIAHEINNPLAIISGYFEIINQDLDVCEVPKEVRQKVQKTLIKQQDAVQRITKIVNGLRLTSKPDNCDVSNIDIHELLNDTIAIAESAFFKNQIELTKDFQAQNHMALGNYGKFQQVLLNLLVNAKDAVENRPHPKVTIRTQNERGLIKFSVIDNGAGIKSENHGKIFVPFYTSKDPNKGTGLGLYISRDIVTSVGGEITFSSHPEKETTFTISLPFISPVTISAPEEYLTIQKPPSISGRALVIDDEEEIRFLLKKILESFGISVILAGNGFEGLEKMRSHHFDFIITDMIMPVMNGEKFLEEAKKLELKRTKFFVITGNVCTEEQNTIHPTLHDMIHNFIQKPFSHKDILDVLTTKQEVRIL